MNIVKKSEWQGATRPNISLTVWQQPDRLPQFDNMSYEAKHDWLEDHVLHVLRSLDSNRELLQQVLEDADINGTVTDLSLVTRLARPELRGSIDRKYIYIKIVHWPYNRPVREESRKGPKFVCPHCGYTNCVPPSTDVRRGLVCWGCGQSADVDTYQHTCDDGCWYCAPHPALAHEWDGGCGLYAD